MSERDALRRGNAGKGRPKGAKNKSTLEIAKIAGDLVRDATYQRNLLKRMRSGKVPPAVETMFWHYAYGKPRDVLKLEQDSPFVLQHVATPDLLARLHALTVALGA